MRREPAQTGSNADVRIPLRKGLAVGRRLDDLARRGVTILGAFYFKVANRHGVCRGGGVIDISSVCSDACNP